jgi:hypothetical protein
VGVTGASLVQALLLWVFASRHLEDRRGKEIAASFARTLAASLLAAAAAVATLRALASLGASVPVQALAATAAGVLAFGLAAALVGSQELKMLSGALRRRLGRGRGRSGPS